MVRSAKSDRELGGFHQDKGSGRSEKSGEPGEDGADDG